MRLGEYSDKEYIKFRFGSVGDGDLLGDKLN